MEALIGQTIQHYRVLEELGAGGMGVVYRAEDLRLGREVALKFLPAGLAGRDEALERFRREARLASALSHPNICIIHDIIESTEEGGRQFIVMELLEGVPLKQLIAGQPMRIERVVDYGMQIAEALEAAHRRGIIHRDIKPANVFVTRTGQVKVLDFGLAKFAHERRPVSMRNPGSSDATISTEPEVLTDPGGQVGTMVYMSPEQATGGVVDTRTDLFSFGVVLYEMATGTRAFPGRNVAILFDAILNRPPIAPSQINPSVPIELEQLIEKAIEKDPALRYQDAADIIADLRRLKRSLGVDTSMSGWSAAGDVTRSGPVLQRRATDKGFLPRLRRWPVVAGLVVAGGILALAAMSMLRTTTPALTERDSVLLAHFANNTGDPVFDDTLRQALAVQLSQSPFLHIVPDERIRETMRLMGRSPEERLTSQIAREVCERQGVKGMLEGSISSIGRLYVVTLDAINCRTGEAIAREQSQSESKEEVLGAVGSIASIMRRKLGESLGSLQKFDVPIEQATTTSLEALKSYTLGVSQRVRAAEIESIPFFVRATELDPKFASVYIALSTVYGNLGESAKAEEYANLAYANREHVSERERLFITYQYHDRVTGDQNQVSGTLEVWKQSFPRDPTPPNNLANHYNRLGQFERAVDEAREAQRRNPSVPFPYSNLAYAYRGLNQYDDALKTGEEAIALGIETLPTRRLMYQLALLKGDLTSARAHAEWARDRPREFDLIGAEAQAAAFEGRMREAREIYQRAIELAERRRFAETATGYAVQVIWTELLYGNERSAVEGAKILARNPAVVPRLRAASVLARLGSSAEAEEAIAKAAAVQPQATLNTAIHIPLARAAIALGRGAPDSAIERLREAIPYDFGQVAALATVYLRGDAFLMKRAGPSAAAEFQKIIDHRGTDPFSSFYGLAHLGLGRAAMLAGDEPAARRMYGEFFTLFANADEDLPILQAARAEYARLTRTGK